MSRAALCCWRVACCLSYEKSMPRKPVEPDPIVPPAFKALLWTLAAAAACLLAAALLSYDPLDRPSAVAGVPNAHPSNLIGTMGATLAHHLYLMLGPTVWILLVGWTVLGVRSAVGRGLDQPVLARWAWWCWRWRRGPRGAWRGRRSPGLRHHPPGVRAGWSR